MRAAFLYGLCLALVLPLAAQAARTAGADPADALGGHVVAEIDGRTVAFPTLKTEISGEIDGDIATVRVRQVFANPTQVPLNARYLFPLNIDAAVHAMTMEVAGEIVTAVIQKKAEARQTFETAKSEGRAAALLEQHRPNMFTQEIANLMPGMPVTVTIEYSQAVPRLDGAYELRVPLVVGPRYIPAGPDAQLAQLDAAPQRMDDETPVSETVPPGLWRFDPVPAYPEVAGLTIPPQIDAERVSIRVTLISGVPIGSITSTTHALAVAGGDNSKTITLAGGATIDNRDFVLRYSLSGEAPQAGVLTHRDDAGGTFSILVEPPAVAREGDVAAREMVFILDTSGSMSGRPINASKAFMRAALDTLRPADFFRIIQFSNSASEFSAGPIAATPANLAAGARYVDGLQATGGTEVLSGLRAAYARPTPPNLLRIVVFLSDGYVGNEDEILRLVTTEVGKGRLYAFGIGSSVNRYLIVEMARLGRGLSRVIDPTEDGREEAIAFAGTLRAPVLTDIAVDWGDLAPQAVTPAFIPDLFEGDSIRVMGRFAGDAGATIRLAGRVNGRPVTMPLVIPPAAADTPGGAAIPLIWARSRIEDHMRELAMPDRLRQSGLSDDALAAQVTDLGLEHSLVTRWTSFVAVSQQVVNRAPEAARDADVPLPMVEGVTAEAYPNAPRPQRSILIQPGPGKGRAQASGPVVAFSGGSTPEPERVLGLGLMLVALFCAWLRRRILAARVRAGV